MSIVLLAASAGGEDWSRFRGPNGGGVASARRLPVELGTDRNLAWEVEVPFGRSTPVVAGERIFLTAATRDRFLVLALDRTSGTTLWRAEVVRDRTDEMYHDQDSASPSPVTDGENVYAFFQETGLVSFDGEGRERWRLRLGPFRNFYGIASSPVLAGARLFLLCDQANGSFLLAVDKDSGEVLWRRERPARQESYTTPLFYPHGEAPRALLVLGSRWLDAYDPGTGEPLWAVSGLGAGPVASPVLAGDLLVVSAPDQAAQQPPSFAEILGELDVDGDGLLVRDEVAGHWMSDHFGFLDVGGDGRLTAGDWEAVHETMKAEAWGVFALRMAEDGGRPQIVWNHRQNVPYIPTPVIVDGVVYIVERGIVTSLDAASGQVHHRGRLGSGSPAVHASPVSADGKIYMATLDGEVFVLSAQAQWEILAANSLGAPIHASPVVGDGQLLIRTKERLYSFVALEEAPGGAPPQRGAS